MSKITCTLVEETNTVMVWCEGELVAMVQEGEDKEYPEVRVYGNGGGVRVFSFEDFEVMKSNWDKLQNIRNWKRDWPSYVV